MNLDLVFLNKFVGALDANQWSKDYWPAARARRLGHTSPQVLRDASHVHYRNLKQGELLKAIGDYCGTRTIAAH